MRLRKNPDDILYSSTSLSEIEIVTLTRRDPNVRTWFLKIFSSSWLVMTRRNDMFCVTDIIFSHPKYACVKWLNTKKMQCLKWMNNSDHDDCCDKLQEKVIKITLYDKMNYKPIFIGSHLRRHHYQHSPLLSYKTNQFHVAVNLYSNRSQKRSKCDRNLSDTLGRASYATFLF